jgi:hypothetical protein
VQEIHVNTYLNRSLSIDHDKVDLSQGPIKEKAKDKKEMDGEPSDDGGVSVIIIYTTFLLTAM